MRQVGTCRSLTNRLTVLACSAALCAGCVAPRSAQSPLLARGNPFDTENQIMLVTNNPGPEAYAILFEKVLDVFDDDFEISYANRYDGRIEGQPRIAAGLEQPWRAGSPGLYDRFLYTCQTYRHRGFVLIQPTERGYQIGVTMFRELEDLAAPSRDTAGGAAFRSDANVDRRFEVADPAVVSHVWVPKGRDTALEQKILRKIRWRLVRDE